MVKTVRLVPCECKKKLGQGTLVWQKKHRDQWMRGARHRPASCQEGKVAASAKGR